LRARKTAVYGQAVTAMPTALIEAAGGQGTTMTWKSWTQNWLGNRFDRPRPLRDLFIVIYGDVTRNKKSFFTGSNASV